MASHDIPQITLRFVDTNQNEFFSMSSDRIVTIPRDTYVHLDQIAAGEPGVEDIDTVRKVIKTEVRAKKDYNEDPPNRDSLDVFIYLTEPRDKAFP